MSNIQNAINTMETEVLKFRPSNDFYNKIGISKKRFWQLVRDEKSATIDELHILSKALGVEISKLF